MKKLSITSRRYYFLSLGIVLLLSFYPVLMGIRLLSAFAREGYVNTADYPKYVIPYTPIAIALIAVAALLPLIVRLCKNFALAVASLLGTGIFLGAELLFEKVTVFTGTGNPADVISWQAFSCFATPAVMQTLGDVLTGQYSPAFKLHFYIIAILIILGVIGVIHGFGRMIHTENYDKKKPLIIQTATVAVFIALCILACFTAFYRTGKLELSPLSSWLMSVFFVIFGITAGTYSGTLLYFKKPVFSRLVPALAAALTTFVMYLGELILMGGVLFKFGRGFLFDPLGACPFAPVDLFVILLSGAITYLILFLIRQKNNLTPS